MEKPKIIWRKDNRLTPSDGWKLSNNSALRHLTAALSLDSYTKKCGGGGWLHMLLLHTTVFTALLQFGSGKWHTPIQQCHLFTCAWLLTGTRQGSLKWRRRLNICTVLRYVFPLPVYRNTIHNRTLGRREGSVLADYSLTFFTHMSQCKHACPHAR